MGSEASFREGRKWAMVGAYPVLVFFLEGALRQRFCDRRLGKNQFRYACLMPFACIKHSPFSLPWHALLQNLITFQPSMEHSEDVFARLFCEFVLLPSGDTFNDALQSTSVLAAVTKNSSQLAISRVCGCDHGGQLCGDSAGSRLIVQLWVMRICNNIWWRWRPWLQESSSLKLAASCCRFGMLHESNRYWKTIVERPCNSPSCWTPSTSSDNVEMTTRHGWWRRGWMSSAWMLPWRWQRRIMRAVTRMGLKFHQDKLGPMIAETPLADAQKESLTKLYAVFKHWPAMYALPPMLWRRCHPHRRHQMWKPSWRKSMMDSWCWWSPVLP